MYRIVAALLLFGISFGYVEAAVVAYLRALYDPIRQRVHPGRHANDLFPLVTPPQLESAGAENTRRLLIEIGREAATIVMLAAFGLAMGRTLGQQVAAFAVAFGVWNISFYAFLRWMIHWPPSLFTWDILFLIPVPWVAPVAAPVLVALSMIVCGLIALHRDVKLGRIHWLAILAGGVLTILSFTWDFRNTMAGGMPNPFNWPLFAAGQVIGLAGFLVALWNREYPESRRPPGS